MEIGLAAACTALLLLTSVLAFRVLRERRESLRLRSELQRYQEITDLEAHTAEQRAKADAAIAETEQARTAVNELQERAAGHRAAIGDLTREIDNHQHQLSAAAALLGEYKTLDDLRKEVGKQKQRAAQYMQVLGNFRTAEELRKHIAEQQGRVEELAQVIGKLETIPQLDQQILVRQQQIQSLESRVRELYEVLGGADTAGALHARIQNQQKVLAEVEAQIQKVEEALEMQEFGFYRPRYDFETSSIYQLRIDQVREQQKALVKSNSAVAWATTWTVQGSDVQGRRMMAEQTKLLLRAFNGECDAAVAKVKYNNITTLESRISKSWEQLNRLGKTNQAVITDQYLRLKLQELCLVHEHRVKQQQEKEEQRRIKEQMREEEKAQREFEEAQARAAKEEEIAECALERARRAFEEATRGQLAVNEQARAQNAALAAQVAKLENELKDAIDRKAKAIARAQLTKSGHIYVLSNIGSFGTDVYKIGMTRRLDPFERVQELGDASVPFPFDVHAAIYSQNAPELEYKLHQHFAARRLNLVNTRREYFRVSLEEVISAVAKFHGEITFVKYPEAAEYRETMAKRKAEGVGMADAVAAVGLS